MYIHQYIAVPPQAKLERSEAQTRLLGEAAKEKDSEIMAAARKTGELESQVCIVAAPGILLSVAVLRVFASLHSFTFSNMHGRLSTCLASHSIGCFHRRCSTGVLRRTPCSGNDPRIVCVHNLPSIIIGIWSAPNWPVFWRQVEALRKAQAEGAADASRKEQLLQEEASALRCAFFFLFFSLRVRSLSV